MTLPEAYSLEDIVVCSPPITEITNNGTVRHTIAQRITDDFELEPFGFVLTIPFEAANKLSSEKRNGIYYSGGRVVVGTVRDIILFSDQIRDSQPWYKKSADKKVKIAEQNALTTVLGHIARLQGF